jgi:hypothetical protein
LLHTPQSRSSEARSTHAPEHAVKPFEQVLVHVPCEQTLSLGQAVPQAPQCALLFSGSTQAPAQVIWPGGQTHAPREQVVPPPHAVPHAPQLPWSDWGSTHCPPQAINPSAHPRPALPPSSVITAVRSTAPSVPPMLDFSRTLPQAAISTNKAMAGVNRLLMRGV